MWSFIDLIVNYVMPTFIKSYLNGAANKLEVHYADLNIKQIVKLINQVDYCLTHSVPDLTLSGSSELNIMILDLNSL